MKRGNKSNRSGVVETPRLVDPASAIDAKRTSLQRQILDKGENSFGIIHKLI